MPLHPCCFTSRSKQVSCTVHFLYRFALLCGKLFCNFHSSLITHQDQKIHCCNLSFTHIHIHTHHTSHITPIPAQNSTSLLGYLYANPSSFSFLPLQVIRPGNQRVRPHSHSLFRVILTNFLFLSHSRSAAEIDELYERRVPAWRWSRTRTDAEVQMEAVVQVKGHVKQV